MIVHTAVDLQNARFNVRKKQRNLLAKRSKIKFESCSKKIFVLEGKPKIKSFINKEILVIKGLYVFKGISKLFNEAFYQLNIEDFLCYLIK